MHRKITFVTSNIDKFTRISNYIKEFDSSISLEFANIELTEIQSLDLKEVALLKAKEAFNMLRKPLIVDDGGIYLEQYNNFPGPISKHVFQGIGCEGIWKLAKNNPKAYLLVSIVYIDDFDSYRFFEGKCEGTIIEPGEDALHEITYYPIFVPKGYDKPLSVIRKIDAIKQIDQRRLAIRNLVLWLNKNE